MRSHPKREVDRWCWHGSGTIQSFEGSDGRFSEVVQCYELHGVREVEFPKTGDELSNDRQAIGIISEASVYQPELIVMRAERLSGDFFRLKAGVAHEILQKFATYRKHVVVLGNVSAHLNASSALQHFIYECNAGHQIWFVTSLSELDRKLLAQTRVRDP